MSIIMTPFVEKGYMSLHMSVGRYVGMSVGPVDHMVSAQYLQTAWAQDPETSHVGSP